MPPEPMRDGVQHRACRLRRYRAGITELHGRHPGGSKHVRRLDVAVNDRLIASVDTGYVRTYSLSVKNITLSVDERDLEEARKVAKIQGKSLNTLIRDYIATLAGKRRGDELLEEFETMWREPGNSGGWTWNRDEIYEERLGRTGNT